jgi:hypothetical protein
MSLAVLFAIVGHITPEEKHARTNFLGTEAIVGVA